MAAELSHKRPLSEEEFGRLFLKSRPMFVAIANSYVHDRIVAEDLVNDAFVRFWEKRDGLLTENFEAYLFQTVVRKCLDHLKAEQTRSRIREKIHRSESRMLTYEINSLESCDPNRLFATEVETIFRECLDRMPEITREVFMASRFQNKTYKEIADSLGIPVRRVTAEIQAALQQLRISLKDYLPAVLLFLLFGGDSASLRL